MSQTPRLFVEAPLSPGADVALDQGQAHYLGNVLRLGAGAELELFNGRDGAWSAALVGTNKRGGVARAAAQVAPQRDPPDLWLLFAPLKKARTDFAVEKAVELGVSRIQPVSTAFTNAERLRRDKLQAHAVEAAEQCGATFVPEVADLGKLTTLLDRWPDDRQLLFCDEALAGEAPSIPAISGPWAILIGPEGGFSQEERARLRGLPFAHPIALGPRILRAETALVAALTLWQVALGDWTGARHRGEAK